MLDKFCVACIINHYALFLKRTKLVKDMFRCRQDEEAHHCQDARVCAPIASTSTTDLALHAFPRTSGSQGARKSPFRDQNTPKTSITGRFLVGT